MTTATLTLLDAARPLRRRLIDSLPAPEVTHSSPDADELRILRLDAKRRAAIAALGEKWVFSPAYVFNPRHSADAEVYRTVPGPLDAIRSRAVAAGRI